VSRVRLDTCMDRKLRSLQRQVRKAENQAR
jgi:hypothetical protein